MLYDNDLASRGERRARITGSFFDSKNCYKREESIYNILKGNSQKQESEILTNTTCISCSKNLVANIAQYCFHPFRIACSFTFHRGRRVFYQKRRKFWRISLKEELNTRYTHTSKVHRGSSDERIAKFVKESSKSREISSNRFSRRGAL